MTPCNGYSVCGPCAKYAAAWANDADACTEGCTCNPCDCGKKHLKPCTENECTCVSVPGCSSCS